MMVRLSPSATIIVARIVATNPWPTYNLTFRFQTKAGFVVHPWAQHGATSLE
jgi:hypothetical protein